MILSRRKRAKDSEAEMQRGEGPMEPFLEETLLSERLEGSKKKVFFFIEMID